MNWIFLALLAPALDTVVNFIDKYVIEHKLKDGTAAPVYSALAILIFSSAVWLTFGMPLISSRNAALLLSSGIVFMWGSALYFHALAKTHTSYVVAMLQAVPLFTLVFAIALLGEKLGAYQFIGFVLVILGALGLSLDRAERKMKLSKAFFQILIADILFAASTIIVKLTVDLEGFVSILAFSGWGIALGGISLFLAIPKVRRSFFSTLSSVGRPTLAAMFLNDSLAMLSQAVTFLAITLGPVALVSVLASTQVFYGIALGIILTLVFPKIFHEQIAKKDITINVAMSFLLFVGILLIGDS